MIRLRKILLAVIHLGLGLLLGILLLEPVFRSNTMLLPRGIAAPLPVDPPLTDRLYEIRYADADIYYWQSSLVRPPEENLLEAVVRWRTDEFGFPNPAPSPSKVDLVVLGRSYAMGAQTDEAWPSRLHGMYGWTVLNLSQTGAGIREKQDFLTRFGLPRNPQYAVIEILPSIDILEYGVAEPLVVQRAVFPFAQSAIRKLFPPKAGDDSSFIYPLRLEWAGGGCDCVFYSGYLAALSLSKEDWARSSEWNGFRTDLIGLTAALRQAGVVPILLYVPTKETIYLPLADDLTPLERALAAAGSWTPSGGELRQSTAAVDPLMVRANVSAAEDLIRDFAGEQSLCLVDPSDEFSELARDRLDPFMRYDTHWNGVGHSLVMRAMAAAMESGACR